MNLNLLHHVFLLHQIIHMLVRKVAVDCGIGGNRNPKLLKKL
jgi:hypothetical protein